MDIRHVLPLSVAPPTIQSRLLVSRCCRTVCTTTCGLKQLTRRNSLLPVATQNLFGPSTVLSWARHVARYGREVRRKPRSKTLNENYLEDLGVGGRMILKLMFVKWANFAQNRDQWRVLVNM